MSEQINEKAGYSQLGDIALDRFSIIGLGGDLWTQLRKFARETMLAHGVISQDDISFVHPVGSVEEAMQFVPLV